ncbi:MAG: hypothetical protein VCA57_15285 [Pseudomonas sp.]
MTKTKVNRCLHKQELEKKPEANTFPASRSQRADTPPCARSQILISQE